MISYFSTLLACGYMYSCTNNDTEKPNENTYQFKIFHTINNAESAIWDTVVSSENHLMRTPFLRTMEQTHAEQMDFRYAILYKNGEAIGAAYFQIISVSGDNLREKKAKQPVQQADANECAITFVGQKFKDFIWSKVKKYSMRLMICGNSFITGEYGFHYTSAIDTPNAFALLSEIVNQIQKQEEVKKKPISMVLLKDYFPETLQAAKVVENDGFNEMMAEPNMILKRRPHWSTFDDYLQSMSAKYRTRAKSAYKKSKTLIRRELSLEDIVHNLDHMYDMYRYVVDKAEIVMATATPNYFVQLKQNLGNRLKVLGYYEGDKLIGFIMILLMGKFVEAHFVGYDKDLNRKYKLYSNVLYDVVKEGIAQQADNISFGRTALEIKSTIGAEGVNMNCFIRHNNYLSNQLIVPLVNRFREDDWTPRHPFKEEAAKTKQKTKAKRDDKQEASKKDLVVIDSANC